ncbi:MAG: hypothetical protein EA417_15325 [Gammaproteobacteria bacterium]|nr:MAG: hypothetical protein EA417_15325 [Gammaproteobacteria bacterium]
MITIQAQGGPWLLAALLSLSLASCAQNPPVPAPEPGPPPVGAVTLMTTAQPPREDLQLNIGVRVFENASQDLRTTPVNETTFARIRTMETHYLPVVLRNTLMASNQWGVVRVLPEDDPSVDLLIRGTIIESSGASLTLHVQATDSSGREWLDRVYSGRAYSMHYQQTPSAMGDGPREEMKDPFLDVYAQIANDLLTAKTERTERDIETLIHISELNHAADLSPDAFDAMLGSDGQGRLSLARLPAGNDPMLARVAAMRERHHIFIDTIDEYYDALYLDVKHLYDLWRQYSHDQVVEAQTSRRRARNSMQSADNFEVLRRNYDRYRWAKIFEQEFVGLAAGFVNETAPAVLELNRRVHGLAGSVEEQYAQWRELLRALFELETGGVFQGDDDDRLPISP